jgi:hypothetical protein
MRVPLVPAPTRAAPAAVRAAIGVVCGLSVVLSGCATRSADILPALSAASDFMAWDCVRIDDELERVQQRAADVAYSVDERAGNNILALGMGLSVFWPALFALRPDGLEAAELSRLKGRDEALRSVAKARACPPAPDTLSAARAAALPLVLGERLVYEDRAAAKGAPTEWVMVLAALRRGEIEYREVFADGHPAGVWRQDLAGNVLAAPAGALSWPHLLRSDLSLGAVTGGDMLLVGDPLSRARMRGQVVAVGPQTVAGRRFDVAVVELFGDAQRGDASTRVEGAIVVDRSNGVLLRLDLRSANASFALQRRLVRVDEPGTVRPPG